MDASLISAPQGLVASDLVARSLRHVWHPCTQMKRASEHSPPLPIVRGTGPWLMDADGRRYFDAISSWWVNLFGHADARLNAALKDQLDTLSHVMLAGCTHAPAVDLAEALSNRTGGVLGHAFYGSDGASAIEIALKMSFHAWRNLGQGARREFVCLRQSYHGETLGALAVTDVAIFRDAYDPLLMRAHLVDSPDARQVEPGERPEDVEARALADLERLLQARGPHIAAVIIEPLVQCAAGMAMHAPSYVRGVRALCDAFGVHLIADEIAVGCGRSGTFFACEQAGIWPDFITLSKGITGGYLPLSVVLTRDAVYQAFWDDSMARGFLHSHSYTGNPLACRAATTVLQRFADDDVLARNALLSQGVMRTWSAALAGDERVTALRQRGMIWAFDVSPERAGVDFSERFHQAGRRHELMIRPIGRTVYVMPPYLQAAEVYVDLAERVLATLDEVVPR
ncbi:adenosylmethionine--8-amino-7-oxononanoate transaminase [Leptothrix ochracea]|uniref:adenosylmethionine--8-amino-7-oxononanoate transaminase n=1 Tax=Leptothrix ochracea TaxID=735331 RepID=UPI0034E19959